MAKQTGLPTLSQNEITIAVLKVAENAHVGNKIDEKSGN